jgi:hypothetical protein
MSRIAQCASLAEVRHNIDLIDRPWLLPMAERLAQAAMHPPSPQLN